MRISPVAGFMSMPFSNPAGNDWMISVPLSELVALQGLPAQMKKLEDDNKQLRRELEALRTIQSQMMLTLADAIRGRRS